MNFKMQGKSGEIIKILTTTKMKTSQKKINGQHFTNAKEKKHRKNNQCQNIGGMNREWENDNYI